jgi:hypothetical protein
VLLLRGHHEQDRITAAMASGLMQRSEPHFQWRCPSAW